MSDEETRLRVEKKRRLRWVEPKTHEALSRVPADSCDEAKTGVSTRTTTRGAHSTCGDPAPLATENRSLETAPYNPEQRLRSTYTPLQIFVLCADSEVGMDFVLTSSLLNPQRQDCMLEMYSNNLF